MVLVGHGTILLKARNLSHCLFSLPGHRYPPPPLSLRPGSEGTSPSFSPDPRPPPHSASARVQHGQFDLNNSLGTMSAKTPSSSTSGGGGAGSGSHFTFNEATPPPRPPPHRPMNSVSHDAAIWKSALSVWMCVTQYHVIGFLEMTKRKGQKLVQENLKKSWFYYVSSLVNIFSSKY